MAIDAILGQGEIPTKMCDALGINGHQCKGFSVRVYGDEAILVTVEMYVAGVQAQALVEVMKKYDLVVREQEETPPNERTTQPTDSDALDCDVATIVLDHA